MRYRCTVCGYIYVPGVPFEELPKDWVCPVCKAPKDKFERVIEAQKADGSSAGKADSKTGTDLPVQPVAPAIRRYTNGEITVVWQSAKCNHNGNCYRMLPQVFNPKARPWVNMSGAGSDAIAKVVEQCPTGALSVTWEKT